VGEASVIFHIQVRSTLAKFPTYAGFLAGFEQQHQRANLLNLVAFQLIAAKIKSKQAEACST
jgi:hypothetical protein